MPKTTLWIWPTGFFPRRVLYYFYAKGISTSTLREHNIHLIPVTLELPIGLIAMPGYETRPADSSLPTLRIQYTDGREYWIKETMAILEYFEEVFPASEKYPSLLGSTIEQRARTRDIQSLLSETSHWNLISLMHSNNSIKFWAGVADDEKSPAAAANAQTRFHALLSRLETWVSADILEKQTKSLSGEGGDVTLADIMLMAQIEYGEMMFGMDFVEEHGVLRIWYEKAKKEQWYVSTETLKSVEKGEGWESVLR